MRATSRGFFLDAGALLVMLLLAVGDNFQKVIGGDGNLLSRLDVVELNKFRRQVQVEGLSYLQHAAIFCDRLTRIVALGAAV